MDDLKTENRYKLIEKDLNKFDTVIVCGLRHGDCYSTIERLKNNWDKIQYIEGFLDSDGCFYTRKEASREAFKIGQLLPTVENLFLQNKHYQD